MKLIYHNYSNLFTLNIIRKENTLLYCFFKSNFIKIQNKYFK